MTFTSGLSVLQSFIAVYFHTESLQTSLTGEYQPNHLPTFTYAQRGHGQGHITLATNVSNLETVQDWDVVAISK